MMVAVTGAAGKSGLQVLSAFVRAGHRVRALARDEAGAARIAAVCEADTIIGDMRDATALTELLEGCQAVYHIPPNMSQHELEMARALAEACRPSAATRFVYHSVLHPQCETMPHHWSKMQVESYLLTSGLDVVFLQPAPYMQNLHPYLTTALDGGQPEFPYGEDVRLSMVDLRDVAEAAVNAVVGDQHNGGAYQLCAEDRLTQGQAWARACDALAITVPFRSISPEQWRRTVGDTLPDEVADRLARMFDHYDAYGLAGSSVPLRALLGRRPTSFAEHLWSLARRGSDLIEQDEGERARPGREGPAREG